MSKQRTAEQIAESLRRKGLRQHAKRRKGYAGLRYEDKDVQDWNASDLARYFKNELQNRYGGFILYNQGAVAKHVAQLRKDGVDSETIKAMVDLYVSVIGQKPDRDVLSITHHSLFLAKRHDLLTAALSGESITF